MNNNVANFPIRKIGNEEFTGFKGGEPPDGGDMWQERVIKLEGKVDLLDYKIDTLNNDIDKRFTETNKNIEKAIKQSESSMKIWIMYGVLGFVLTILPSFIINISKIFQALH